jgi:hypothetical protein
VEVAAGGAVAGEGGEGGAGFASFRDFEGCLGATHVGFDPAGMGGVDLDFGVAEFVGEMDGEGVEGGFGGVVGEGLGVIDGGLGVGLEGERAEDAGEVDDAAGGTLANEGEKDFSECNLGEEVGFEDLVEQVEGDIGGAVLGAGAGKAAGGDSGVVDEDVEKAVLGVEVVVGGFVAGGAGDVEERRCSRRGVWRQLARPARDRGSR